MGSDDGWVFALFAAPGMAEEEAVAGEGLSGLSGAISRLLNSSGGRYAGAH